MQTWIKANIGSLLNRMTKAEDAISGSTAYTNETDLDNRTSALETAVGMPYTNETNISTRLTNIETAQTSITTDITNIETALNNVSFWKGTESAYAAITTPAENTLYLCYADPVQPVQSKSKKKG